MSSYKLKISLIGAAAVGKTSIVQRLVKDKFQSDYKLTAGMDILTKDIEFLPGKFATLSIWDTGGQQRFEFTRSTFYKGTSGAVLVYDISREQTLTEIKKWYDEFKQHAGENAPGILVGNKSDLAADLGKDFYVISKEGGLKLAKELNVEYLEVSAKEGFNVVECFSKLTQEILKNRGEAKPRSPLKPERQQTIEEIMDYILTQNYNKLEHNLKEFNEIQSLEEFSFINLLIPKLSSNLMQSFAFLYKLILLKWLYKYTPYLDDIELSKAEISEKIALECIRAIQNIEPQDLSKTEEKVIRKLFLDLDLNKEEIGEYIKCLGSHYLLEAYSIYLKFNYNKLKNYLYQNEVPTKSNLDEYRAFSELANIDSFYFELVKNWIMIMEDRDIEHLNNIRKNYQKVRSSIPGSTQLLIENAFSHIMQSFPLVIISQFKVKDKNIKVDETYVILEIEIKNNTIKQIQDFYIKIEPTGFENYSYDHPFIRSFKLEPREKEIFFVELGKSKTMNCPINFKFISNNEENMKADVLKYINIKHVEEIKPKDISAQNIQAPFEPYVGSDSFIFISYSHVDKLQVYSILENLNQLGIKFWFDKGIEVSNHWKKVIVEKIEQCAAFLVFITPNIIGAENIRKEIDFAVNEKKKYFAVVLKKTELPKDLLFDMAGIQYIEKYLMPETEFYKRLNKGLNSVLNRLK